MSVGGKQEGIEARVLHAVEAEETARALRVLPSNRGTFERQAVWRGPRARGGRRRA